MNNVGLNQAIPTLPLPISIPQLSRRSCKTETQTPTPVARRVTDAIPSLNELWATRIRGHLMPSCSNLEPIRFDNHDVGANLGDGRRHERLAVTHDRSRTQKSTINFRPPRCDLSSANDA